MIIRESIFNTTKNNIVHNLAEKYGLSDEEQRLFNEYTIEESVESSVELDEHNTFLGVNGEYRVKDVLINCESLDLTKKYTLASHNYFLRNGGDGYIFTGKCDIVRDDVMTDAELLAAYISDTMGGVITDTYSAPYGEGRIKITSGADAAGDVQSVDDSAEVENPSAGTENPSDNPATGAEMPVVFAVMSLAAVVLSKKNRK